MLNLRNFKDEEEARQTIAVKNVLKLLEVNGTRLVHADKAAELLVGDENETLLYSLNTLHAKFFLRWRTVQNIANTFLP